MNMMKNAFKKSESDTKKDYADNKITGFKINENLSYKWNDKTKQMETNYYKWKRNWEIKIGGYFISFPSMLREMVWTAYDYDTEVAKYKTQSLHGVTKDYFQLSDAQMEELELIEPGMRRDAKFTDFFLKFVKETNKKNQKISQVNIAATEHIKNCVKESIEVPKLHQVVFKDVMSSLTVESRGKVMNHVEVHIDDEGESKYTYEEAESDSDWVFIFKAAKATHVKRMGHLDEIALLQIQKMQEGELRKVKQIAGMSFDKHIQNFRDALDAVSSTGLELAEAEKKLYFMGSIDTHLFKNVLQEYSSQHGRKKLNEYKTLDELIEYLISELISQSVVNYDIDRYQYGYNKYDKENTLNSIEEKKSISNSNEERAPKGCCNICFKRGHFAKDCRYRNEKFSVEENREFYKKKQAEKEAEGGSESKGSSRNPSRAGTPSKSKKKETNIESPILEEECNVGIEIPMPEGLAENLLDVDAVEDNYVELPDEIVLLYDTGSESGILHKDFSKILEDLHKEVACIKGQGGKLMTSVKSGSNTFGLFRQVNSEGCRSVISHYEAEKNWKLEHISRGFMQLVDWPDRAATGKRWNIFTDPERFGCDLPHLVISRDEIKDLFRLYSPNDESNTDTVIVEVEKHSLFYSSDEDNNGINDGDAMTNVEGDIVSEENNKFVEAAEIVEYKSDLDKDLTLISGEKKIEYWIKYYGGYPTAIVMTKDIRHCVTTELKGVLESLYGVDNTQNLFLNDSFNIVVGANMVQEDNVIMELKTNGQMSSLIERVIGTIQEHVKDKTSRLQIEQCVEVIGAKRPCLTLFTRSVVTEVQAYDVWDCVLWLPENFKTLEFRGAKVAVLLPGMEPEYKC
jgi:hypothetical protein